MVSLKSVLEKLTAEDKLVLLQQVVILPAIEEDLFLSEEEKGDIIIAGKKLGFTQKQIERQIDIQLNEEGAIEEKKSQ